MRKLIIEIPEEVKEVFDKAKEDDLKGSYYDYNSIIGKAIQNGIPLPKCNRCKYYKGVHNVQGHAPCEYHKISGVLWNWYCSQFEAADKDLPSVTLKEKTGKWINDEFGSKCSCCGRYTHLDKFDRPMKFMYCSMCGAKMEVKE